MLGGASLAVAMATLGGKFNIGLIYSENRRIWKESSVVDLNSEKKILELNIVHTGMPEKQEPGGLSDLNVYF